ncbi:hypothetical protein D3C85_875510 [compost metagenome]
MLLAGEVRLWCIAGAEQNLGHRIQIPLDLGVLLKFRIWNAQPVPALGAWREHGLHRSSKPGQSQRRSGLEHLLGALLTTRLVTLEQRTVRPDALSDLLPVRIPYAATALHALLLADDFRCAAVFALVHSVGSTGVTGGESRR